MHRWSPTRSFALPALAAALLCVTVLGLGTAEARPRSVHGALRQISPGAAMHERFLSRRSDGAVLVDLAIRGSVSPDLLRARGVEVNTVAGGWMTARCPIGLLGALMDIPGIDRLDVAERCEPALDLSTADAMVSGLRTFGASDITGQTGEGVVVGNVDSGIDFDHPDFRKPDGTTRIRAFWDQTSTGTPPTGFTYGAEWSEAQINAGTTTEADLDGHGTHTLSIAAGNGRATGNGQPAGTYVGVAPEADIIAVKTDYSFASIADGVSYIFQKAASLGKKAVVNLSVSSQSGPHDGTSGFDQMISALTGPGKIVVVSAGNKQEENMHGQVTLGATLPDSMTLNVPTYTRNAGTLNDFMLLSGWFPGADSLALTITTPRGFVVGPVMPGASGALASIDGFIYAENDLTIPSNGDNEIYIEIYDDVANQPPRTGTWKFTFTPVSIHASGTVDLYLYQRQLGADGVFPVFAQGLAPFGVIGSPGSADSVITVGAHATKDCWESINESFYCWNPAPTLGEIASFSSLGPLRNGALKPDLSAPGYGVAAALSSTGTFPVELIVADGMHAIEAGTSMSAPHVAGAVALLLAQPDWADASPSAIKDRLRSTARADAFTGSVPNPTWGYGKLNAAAAVAPLASLQIAHPQKGFYMPPGKPDSVTVIVAGVTADSVVLDLSLDGGASYPVRLGTLYGVPPGPPRALSFFVQAAWSTIQAKVRGVGVAGATTFSATSDSLFLVQAPVGVEVVASPAAPRFALDGNHPNPFNPNTKIGFEIAKSGRVGLRVYSVQGALVRTLVDGALPAGRYATRWDGRDDRGRSVGSGVYFSQLESDGKRLTRKMSLLK